MRSLAADNAVPDHDLDTTFVRHPLARGVLSLRVSVAWVVGLALVAVGAPPSQPLALLFFAAAVATQFVYCALRCVTLLEDGAVGGDGGFRRPRRRAAAAPLRLSALSLFVFLACWEIGGRNIVNDLSDLDSDARVGIRTVASVRGEAAAARAAAAVAAACLVATTLLPMPPAAVVLALALGVWSLGRPAVKLLRRPTPAEAASYFNHGSLYPDLVLLAALVGLALGGSVMLVAGEAAAAADPPVARRGADLDRLASPSCSTATRRPTTGSTRSSPSASTRLAALGGRQAVTQAIAALSPAPALSAMPASFAGATTRCSTPAPARVCWRWSRSSGGEVTAADAAPGMMAVARDRWVPPGLPADESSRPGGEAAVDSLGGPFER